MRELIQMVVVLTILSAFSGFSLSALKKSTAPIIADQQLKFVKGPAINSILKGASNDPLKDRFELKVGDKEKSFFVGVFDGQPKTVAFETFGKGGYGGDVGLMVGVNIETDKIIAVGVTTHQETPGLGARAKDDPTFVSQFKGLSATDPINLVSAGGKIDAMGGASITSGAVCRAASEATKIYKENKAQLVSKAKAIKK